LLWFLALPGAIFCALNSDLVGRGLFAISTGFLLFSKFNEMSGIYAYAAYCVLIGLICLCILGTFNFIKFAVPKWFQTRSKYSEFLVVIVLISAGWTAYQALAVKEPASWKSLQLGQTRNGVYSTLGEPVIDPNWKHRPSWDLWRTKGSIDNLELYVSYSTSNTVRSISVGRTPKVGLGYRDVRIVDDRRTPR
jgi:hypothetical protein